MSDKTVNPFEPSDTNRHEIWDMLVRRDIEAFVENDWESHAVDFLDDGFFGVDAKTSENPDFWRAEFGSLDSYSKVWQAFAASSQGRLSKDEMREAHFGITTLKDIELNGDFAVAHKKFDGVINYDDGVTEKACWQTVYLCRKKNGRWWIAGFIGFLPNAQQETDQQQPPKTVPSATQHATAGPYSPVVQVNPGQLVVICGQAPLLDDGTVPTTDFTDQTRLTLENCRRQLENGGCNLADVFKVNVYLTNLENWPLFNEVYAKVMPKPYPVRTAVQSGLLDTFLVEIEMWAVKS